MCKLKSRCRICFRSSWYLAENSVPNTEYFVTMLSFEIWHLCFNSRFFTWWLLKRCWPDVFFGDVWINAGVSILAGSLVKVGCIDLFSEAGLRLFRWFVWPWHHSRSAWTHRCWGCDRRRHLWFSKQGDVGNKWLRAKVRCWFSAWLG